MITYRFRLPAWASLALWCGISANSLAAENKLLQADLPKRPVLATRDAEAISKEDVVEAAAIGDGMIGAKGMDIDSVRLNQRLEGSESPSTDDLDFASLIQPPPATTFRPRTRSSGTTPRVSVTTRSSRT